MLKVEEKSLRSLVPRPNNPRTHSEAQVAQIVRSLEEFGWTNPILVDDEDGIIAGHGRAQAAAKLGMDKVPTIRLSHLSEAQRRAYVIADNQLALNAGWDEELKELEVGALDAMDFDVSLLGFSEADLERMRVGAEEAEDEAPEAPAEPVSRLGDLWVLGDHLLLCGDATKAEEVERLGDHGHLMVTDPPYGVNYDPDWRDREAAKHPTGSFVAANKATGKVTADDLADWSPAWALFQGDVAYTWSASGANLVVSGTALIAAGFELRSQIIWRKQHFAISRGHYHGQHECCWYAVRKGRKAHWRGDRKQTTVWDVANASAFGGSTEGEVKTVHSTQKPVELMRRPMLNNSTKGDLVYEPFLGSGSTIIAAQTCDRRCRAIEIDPAYVDVTVLRWQEFTGSEAVLDGGGSFDKVRADRQP